MQKARFEKALLLGLFLLLTFAASALADSTMFRGNPQHTGVYDSPFKYPAQKERWRFKTGHLNRSTPAVADGVVYAGSADGNLYALDAQTGAQKWVFQTPGEITSSPAVANGVVYVNNDAGFFAVDAQTGKSVWTFKTGDPVAFTRRWDFYQSSPVYVDGVLYFGSADSYLYALEAMTGKLLWKFKTEGRVRSSPAVAEGVIYGGSMDGNLYALDAKTGQLKWKFKTAGDAAFPFGEVQSPTAVADGTVFFGSRDGFLYAVDIQTGQKKWAFSHEGMVHYRPGDCRRAGLCWKLRRQVSECPGRQDRRGKVALQYARAGFLLAHRRRRSGLLRRLGWRGLLV